MTEEHLTAAAKVVASHHHMRFVPRVEVRDDLMAAAKAMANGTAGPETERLVLRLEKVTGVTIAQLAAIAEAWPTA